MVTAFSCLVGQFGFPGQESLSELLMVDPEDGAAAVWAPSGLSRNDRARILAEGFYGATFDDAGELVIGESILGAYTTRHVDYLDLDRPAIADEHFERYYLPAVRDRYAEVSLAATIRLPSQS